MINCYLLSEDFVTSQIVIITNFVLESSVGIKRVVYILEVFLQIVTKEKSVLDHCSIITLL